MTGTHTPSGRTSGRGPSTNVAPDLVPAASADPRLLDPRVDDILARLDAPGGYEGFERAVRGAGCCRRPIRLQGRVTRVEGERRTVTFDTDDLCDGVLLKACGSRRETVCPPCAAVYRSDAFHLVAAGLRGGKGVGESVASHPAVMITLTAPSFGPVHRRGRDGRCHPRRRVCRHGTSLQCGRRHDEQERVLGEALCPRCYDFEGAVLFNLSVSELWRRTTIYVMRALAELAGLPVRRIGSVVRLSYVKVAEFQRRGSVHLHVVARLDAAGDEVVAPPAPFDGELLARAVALAVRKVRAPVAEMGPGGRRVRWGDQLDVVVITDEAEGRNRAAAYLAKYSTKSSDSGGVLDHRLRVGVPPRAPLAPQLRRMVECAWQLGDQPDRKRYRLQAWAHTLGFRGHFATKSRRYSTTFGALRTARVAWRADRNVADRGPSRSATSSRETTELRRWSVAGAGYTTRGDAWLAQALARRAHAARVEAYLERCRWQQVA